MAPDQSVDKLSAGASVEALRQPTPDLVDDPSKFESAKQKKTTLLEGIKKFNFKPKRVRLLNISLSTLNSPQGIQFLIDTGFIPSKSPQDVASFLLSTDGLNKAMIGEYLGEG
jgi:brefeldin A-inhibited guanine nucleotide-exchange protein